MKFCFQANIVAELKDTPKRKKCGSSVGEIVAMLKRGQIKVIELPMFLSVPTIILKEEAL